LWGPFWSLPNEFLAGSSAAVGIALINCFGNLGGLVGPFAIGAISRKTGNLQTGLVFVAVSLLAGSILILALRKRMAPLPGAITIRPASQAMPTADTES